MVGICHTLGGSGAASRAVTDIAIAMVGSDPITISVPDLSANLGSHWDETRETGSTIPEKGGIDNTAGL